MIRYMLPLMDKMNHAAPEEATARVRRDHSAGQFLVIAIRDIREGDEVSIHAPARTCTHTLPSALGRMLVRLAGVVSS